MREGVLSRWFKVEIRARNSSNSEHTIFSNNLLRTGPLWISRPFVLYESKEKGSYSVRRISDRRQIPPDSLNANSLGKERQSGRLVARLITSALHGRILTGCVSDGDKQEAGTRPISGSGIAYRTTPQRDWAQFPLIADSFGSHSREGLTTPSGCLSRTNSIDLDCSHIWERDHQPIVRARTSADVGGAQAPTKFPQRSTR